MWYYLENNGRKQWFITSGSDFLDRTDKSWLYLNSEGEQEFFINTGGTLLKRAFSALFFEEFLFCLVTPLCKLDKKNFNSKSNFNSN